MDWGGRQFMKKHMQDIVSTMATNWVRVMWEDRRIGLFGEESRYTSVL